MRSGWNWSKSSSFSPVEAKAMGRPTTSFTERAAPPRASPSSLVRMTPSRVERLVEGLGRGHRVLAGHGVDDQEGVVGLDGPGDVPDLVHQVLVDGQAAGGVDDQDVSSEALGLLEAGGGHGHRVRRLREDGDPGLAAQHPQLLDGGRPLEVGADQQRVAALLLEPAGQLGRCGGLARSLEAGEEDDRRRPAGVADLEGLAAEDGDELLVDDLDDLLARAQALGQLESHAAVAHGRGEGAHDADLDVGLEQGGADLPQDLVDVGLGQAPAAPQAGEDAVESVGQALEHGVLRLPERTGEAVRPTPGRRTVRTTVARERSSLPAHDPRARDPRTDGPTGQPVDAAPIGRRGLLRSMAHRSARRLRRWPT